MATGKFDRYKAAGNARPKEYQMTETFSQRTEGPQRVEPIFDASGSLKRHVMSKLDAEHSEKPSARSRDGETNDR